MVDYRRFYGLKVLDDHSGGRRRAHEADIFREAGTQLGRFLGALAHLTPNCRSRIHLIVMGDMFELWLNRTYLFESTDSGPPQFVPGGENRAADYVAEVMLWNTDVIEAFQQVEQAGLAEVKYIWGNHEAYLMSASVTRQTGLQRRWPEYNGLNGDLHAEHGHRFDSWNFDNVRGWSGPDISNWVFWAPSLRQCEPFDEGKRNTFVRGASLLYLSERIDRRQKPFRVFCMGHTHRPFMRRVKIRINYSPHGREG
jgi:UDP-2,3-diacylglucosamine pyrophosphatase LpxH